MADTTRRAQLIISAKDESSASLKSMGEAAGQAGDKLKGVGDSAGEAGDKFAGSSRAMGMLGDAAKAAAIGGIAALGVAFVASIKSASELESTFARVAGLTNTPKEAIAGLTQEVLRLSTEIPVSANELGKAFYFISSSGYQGAEAMSILTESAKASAAGLGETQTIADAVTSALNAYGLAGSDAARITDVLTMAVKEGKGEPAELAGSLGKILPVAAAAGVSMEQVAASLSIMTRTGLSADEAATALRGTIGALLAPTKQSKDALAEIGLTTDQVATMMKSPGGLVSVLELLMQRTGGNVQQLDAIIPNIRALTGVLSSAGAQGAEYARVLGEMNSAAGTTDAAFAAMADTLEFKLKKAQNSIDALGTSVTSKLLPGLGQAADAASTLINWQDKLSEALQGVNKQLLTTAAGYGDYRDGMLGAAVAAGKVSEAEAEAYRAGIPLANSEESRAMIMQKIERQSGLLNNTLYEQAKAEEAVTQGAYGLNGALDESNRATQRAADATKAGTAANYEAVQSDKDRAASVKAETKVFEEYFKTIQSDVLGVKDFAKAQDELATKAAGIKSDLGESLGQGYSESSDKVQGLTGSLKEVETQIEANRVAHDTATKQFVLNTLTERLAVDGLSSAEQDALMKVADNFGLIDKSTVIAIGKANELADAYLTGKLNADQLVGAAGNLNKFLGSPNAFKTAMSTSGDSMAERRQQIPVAPVIDMTALQAHPLPTIDLPVSPKIDPDAFKGKQLDPIEVKVTPRFEEAKGVAGDSMAERMKQLTAAKPVEIKVDTTAATAQLQTLKKDTDSTTTIFNSMTTLAKSALDKLGISQKDMAGLVNTAAEVGVSAAGKLETAIIKVPKYNEIVFKIITIGDIPDIPGSSTSTVVQHGAQTGADFVVPAGYPNDSYPLRVSSGEHVTVVPQGKTSSGPQTMITYNQTYVLQDSLSTKIVLEQQRLERIRSVADAM